MSQDEEEAGEAPEIELDYGIGRVYIKGDEDSTFEDVLGEFREEREEMVDTIRELKRLEYELQEEFTEGESGGSGHGRGMMQ